MTSYQNLSFSERERMTYMSGGSDGDLISMIIERDSKIASLESDIEELEEEKKNSLFGMDGVDSGGTDLAKAQEIAERSKVLVRSMLDLFATDLMKTVAGRKEIHKQLQAKLIKLGY